MAFHPDAPPDPSTAPATDPAPTSGFHPDAPDTAPAGHPAPQTLIDARTAIKDIPANSMGVQPTSWDIGAGSAIAHGAQGIASLAQRLAHAAGSTSMDKWRDDFRHGAFQTTDEGDQAIKEDPAAHRGSFEFGQLPYVGLGGPAVQGAAKLTSALPAVGKALASSPRVSNIVNSSIAGGALANVGDPEHAGWDSTKSGMEWGAAIPALAQGVGMLAKPAIQAASPYYQQAVDVLRRNGIPLNLAEATGKFSGINRFFKDNPASSGTMEEARKEMLRKYTGAQMHNAGETGDYLDPGVMLDRIGGGLDSVAQRAHLQLSTPQAPMQPGTMGHTFERDLDNLIATAPTISANPSVALANIQALRAAANANGGRVPGSIVQQVRSNLSGAGDPLAEQLKNVIDNHITLQTSLSPLGAEWANLRNQYKNAKVLQGATSPDMEGLASPLKVSQGLNNRFNKSRNTPGSSDPFVQTARAANEVTDKFPNSGTAHRNQMQEIFHTLLYPAVGSVVGGVRDPNHAEGAEYGALAGLGGLAAARAGAGLFNNQSVVDYLTRGAQGPVGRAVSGMMSVPGEIAQSQAGPLASAASVLRNESKDKDHEYQY